MERRFKQADAELVLVQGDITRERTDAIANAANGGLLGGGGVDGAIHRAGGRELLEACRQVKRGLPNGRLPTGQAVITPGFALPARHVIHCVGPIYERERTEAPALLASCYRNALRLCIEHELESIAFPSIGTGVYGYPVDEAAQIALGVVREHFAGSAGPRLVKFALFDSHTFAAYERAAKALFT